MELIGIVVQLAIENAPAISSMVAAVVAHVITIKRSNKSIEKVEDTAKASYKKLEEERQFDRETIMDLKKTVSVLTFQMSTLQRQNRILIDKLTKINGYSEAKLNEEN